MVDRVVNMRGRGLRGPLGIDLAEPVTPGQFLVKAPGGSRRFLTASGTGGADEALREDLAASTGAANVGITLPGVTGAATESLDDVVNRTFLTLERFNITTYATEAQAAVGLVDDTTNMQRLANAAALLGIPVNGNGKWCRAGNIEWQSYTDVRNVNVFQVAGSTDASPFAVSSKSNITFTDCHVNGNRVGQTNMTTSGGDGQRSGFRIYGRCDNIRLIRCRAEYCATDGIQIWIRDVTPASGTDYLATRIYIEEPQTHWNGRHGISTASTRDFRVVGGASHDNGKDMPGYPTTPYTSGGNGRRLGGNLYGRPITAESYLPGEGFRGWTIDGFDGRGNIGGPLWYHRVWEGQTEACYDLNILNCKFDDPNGGNGDGSLQLYAVDNGTDGGKYTGSDALSGLRILNSTFGRNYLNINSTRDIVIEGGSAVITTGPYSVIFTDCINVLKCDLPSNKPVLGRPSPITLLDVVTASGWEAVPVVMSPPVDGSSGRLRYRLGLRVTPTTAGTALVRLVFTPGWVMLPSPPSVFNDVAGDGSGKSRPSANSNNEIDLFLTAPSTSPLSVTVEFEAEPAP